MLAFGNIEIEKNNLYHHKTPIILGDVDIKKVLASNKISFVQKAISALLLTCITVIKLNH